LTFEETSLGDAYLIERERHSDNRGGFERLWCAKDFGEAGLNASWVQNSLSINKLAGTLRGLHFQHPPKMEDKLVICLRGRIYDVIVDLRAGSPTCGKCYSTELAAGDNRALLIPKGFAHGFLTLEDDSHVFYQISEFYAPELACGVRWDDPALKIEWPMEPVVMSDRDRALPGFAATKVA